MATMTNYQFEDSELANFYRSNAVKRPNEKNRSRGGVYFFKQITRKDILSGEEKLDILEYYKECFLEKGMDNEARLLHKIIHGSRVEIIRTCKVLFIPNAERGKIKKEGRLNRELRSLCYAFDSILAGKPNEMARALFA